VKAFLTRSGYCCPEWDDVAPSLEWFNLVEHPGTLVMPSINYHLVKYCPFCGAPAHDRVTTRSALKWIDQAS
jgi:hypothetical protein